MTALETIRDILKKNLDIAPETVTENATPGSLGIDSLDMVELVCDLEDRLGIELDDTDGIATVGDLLRLVEAKQK